ncbi:putative transcriptional regulator, LysR family protein [Actinoplanes cyaneus]|uniref:Transcriptional regulator, LysR family protein n=1 Tax=Actinoplanes cyaneus TaxID=52696 RepID=A0A919IDX6_9ACTN|nr:LysR family transcriptional regulator [Actinoplanes cyaneus]MCW2136006.1 transcriptional regulator, LysR family [Actinoplanes cyaneus]GID62627.1 putative transcriptional regulator, LysR family protein [Actinoplanes cyaneus]
METRLIQYAIAVADELSFTRAAQRVYAAQSTVSAGVRALERDLGTALFERDQRGVRITPAGEAVLPALRALADAEARARTAADPRGELRGELRIGVFSSVSYLAIPRVIGAFHRDHPLVDLHLRASPSGSAELADAVRRGRLDLSLYGLPAATAPGLAVHRLATTPYAAVLPVGHELASRASITLADLADEHFVDAPAGFGNRDVLDAALGARGIVRDVRAEATETSAIPVFVANGLGIALLPELLIPPSEGVAVVPLTERITWDFSVVTRTSIGEATAALLEQLLAAY